MTTRERPKSTAAVGIRKDSPRRSSAKTSALRAARAAALLRTVRHFGRVVLDEEVLGDLRFDGWTRNGVERAVDDLADAGLVDLRPFGGTIEVALKGEEVGQ